LASTILRQMSPRKSAGNAYYGANRFTVLSRDSSPNPSVCSDIESRPRAGSVKRKVIELESTFANVVSGVAGASSVANECDSNTETLTEKVTVEVTKVKSICEKVKGELGKVELPPEVACILHDLCEAVGIVASTQIAIVEGQRPQVKTTAPPRGDSNMVSLGAISKRPRQDLGPKLLPSQANRGEQWTPRISTSPPSEDGTDLKAKKFKEAIKEAEKSTLVFNLDMGRVPIMNKETMSKKATLSLTSMAARKEKKTTSVPSEDALAQIDDVLSVVVGMEFYGAQTKSYRNPKDKDSGSFCSVPVRYDFEHKDDRVRAETVLRSLCDIQCTTPYPAVVKESIRQIVGKVKSEFPDNLIRVNVDTNNMCFKISRKERGEKRVWIPYKCTVPVPDAALDVHLKKVPEDFKISWPVSPRKNSRPSTDAEMTEVTPENPAP
jgi:hypothetical protein